MSNQLQLLAPGQIIPTALHTEMERSYLEYAMSVIVGRALPDVRDGLKPVHRRILYAMHELGLTPDRPFRKCARVVGDVLGKYHPHGDQAVYDALVRMVQTFSSRYPLLAGHGNFGSVDNDPPAAMRYTETRLSPLAVGAALEDISEAIVDFTANFDNSQQEPTVLPTQLPLLLLNGCSGIAVGMATNIPPHHLGEIVDGLIALINNPNLTDEELWRVIPGPDFPTGGEIVNWEGIETAYRTGKGLITVRGMSHIETINTEKKRNRYRPAIIVTELPFQVNKAAWIEKVAELVNEGKIDGIGDLRDESDRTGMRVVIELKKDADPQAILAKLYKMTALQSNFGVIFLALVDNKPVQLSLKQILEEFLKFREETLVRQYRDQQQETRQRLEIVQGLLTALNHLDDTIEVLRFAPDGSTAKIQLQSRLEITEAQADAILSMPLRRLTGLEKQKLQQEHDELQTRLQNLNNLLENRHERLKALKKELRGLKKQFADERRTRLPAPLPVPTTPNPTPTAPSIVETPVDLPTVSSPALVLETETLTPAETASPAKPKKRQKVSAEEEHPFELFTPQDPPPTARLMVNLAGEIAWSLPSVNPPPTEQNPVIFQAEIGGQQQLLIFSDRGKVYPLAVRDIPPLTLTQVPLESLLPKAAQREGEKVIAQGFLPRDMAQDLLLVTTQGRLKRLPALELAELGPRGMTIMKLREDEQCHSVQWIQAQQQLILATSSGRLLRFSLREDRLPASSRNAQPLPALRLRPQETLIANLALDPTQNLFLLTQKGYGKELPLEGLRLGNLGDIGITVMQFTAKQDQLVALTLANPQAQLRVITNQHRQLFINANQFPFQSKDGRGDRLVDLQEEESIIRVIL